MKVSLDVALLLSQLLRSDEKKEDEILGGSSDLQKEATRGQSRKRWIEVSGWLLHLGQSVSSWIPLKARFILDGAAS